MPSKTTMDEAVYSQIAQGDGPQIEKVSCYEDKERPMLFLSFLILSG